VNNFALLYDCHAVFNPVSNIPISIKLLSDHIYSTSLCPRIYLGMIFYIYLQKAHPLMFSDSSK
jgi:hypothetical protein